jgi:hypothetical protein
MKKIFLATAFIFTLVLSAFSVSAQTQTRDDVIKELEVKRAELAVLEKKILAVDDSDREGFASFLSQPQTGAIRLLPREIYDGKRERGLTINGGGAFYSFVRLTHDYGQGSDIMLEQGYFSVGFAGADYGMLLNLGDVSIEQVTNDHAATRAFLDYTPPVKEPEARAEYRKLWQGMEVSGFTFKSRFPAKVSNTYLLRSISFERSDTLVVFRALRKDMDGSFILVYKVLKSFPKPKLERSPTEGN